MKIHSEYWLHMIFPAASLYSSVCAKGLGIVRPLSSEAEPDAWGWNFGSARTPSYWAYGRMRALGTLLQAKQLLNHPSTVLEVAAGDAALSACLSAEGHKTTANDLREENLRLAVGAFKNRHAIRLWPGDVFKLNTHERFDLVIACEVIEHVAHPADLVRHLAQFLKPTGKLLITTPNGSYFRNRLPTYSQIRDFQALEAKQFKPDSDGHLFLLTPEEMRGIARQSNLRVEKLVVWGSPIITGEAGFRCLKLPVRACYAMERALQAAPQAAIEKFGNAMSVVLSMN